MAYLLDKDLKIKQIKFRLGIVDAYVKTANTNKGLRVLVEEATNQVALNLILGDINKNQKISAARKVYRSFGADPNRYRPAADSLMRRIVKGMRITSINNVVDLLNLISFTEGYSISGFDAERIKGDIVFSTGQENDTYYGIGRGKVNITNLPVLRDSRGAFGSPTTDSARTMINLNTSHILLVFYDFGVHDDLVATMEKLRHLLIKHCDGEEIQINHFFVSEMSSV